MGDFNTCLLKDDARSYQLKSIVAAANLTILPLSATHFFPNCKPSLLDLIIVSSSDHVAKHGQFAADAFSYHDLIFLSYKIRPPKARSRTLFQRNFSAMDIDQLRKDAAQIDWNVIWDSATVDEQVAVFNSILITLYDKHAPVRPIRVRHLPAPWLTEEIKGRIQKKLAAKSKFKCKPNDKNRLKYQSARNRCNTVCRDAQRRHIYKSVQDEDPSKVWKFLRSLGVGKSREISLPNDINLDCLNKHYSCSPCINKDAKAKTLSNLSNLPTADLPSFVFGRFSVRDVKKCILSIHSDAVGEDCISRKMIIPILDIVVPVITLILNNSLSTGQFPSPWKDAQIIPLPKKPNPKTFSDYRPISILPFLSKVLERLVHFQITFHLSKHNLLNPFQSGFRPGHSTTSALLKITDDIRHGMENRKLTVLLLLDFSNAFTSVDFDILLGTLRSLNISSAVIDWFRSYLHGRRHRIHVNKTFSNWSDICAGVPQGGVLSPLLFSIFINSISSNLTSFYHLYADDLQIYQQATLSDLPSAIANINRDLNCISEWSISHGLTINPSKSQAIVIGSSRLLARVDWSNLPSVNFNGVIIPYSDSVKNLGLVIDQSLSWGPQIQAVSKKLFAALGSLRRLKNFLPTATKIALAQSLLLPILDYADTCYLDVTEEQLDKLERLQNICIRFIFGLRKYDHVSQYRNTLKWLPIRLRRNAHIVSTLYCVLFNPTAPSYLKERFKFKFQSHNLSLRSSHDLSLLMPVHFSSFYSKSFTTTAVRLWKSLPFKIRCAQTIESFKKQVKDYYLNMP